MIAAVDGKLALAKALVENGVSANTSAGGSTALEMACSNGRTTVAKYLVEKGADIRNSPSCASLFSTGQIP